MILSWMRMHEVEPKKMGIQILRQKEMTYAETLKEVHGALQSEYEISFIKQDKITLLKYNKKEEDYFALTIEGAESEIIALQEDEIIKNSLF